YFHVTGVQTCALPICPPVPHHVRPQHLHQGELIIRQRQQRQLRDGHGHRNTTTRPLPAVFFFVRFGELRIIRRNIRAPTMHTARSIFRADSRCSLPIVTPHRFVRRRALITCVRSTLCPSWMSVRSSTSACVRFTASVNVSCFRESRISQRTACAFGPDSTERRANFGPHV